MRQWSFVMPLADHFNRRPDAGFVRSYDLRAARRQFQVSLVLILVMASAAIALGLMTRLESRSPQSQPAAHADGAGVAKT
jgi:hypothetical protein